MLVMMTSMTFWFFSYVSFFLSRCSLTAQETWPSFQTQCNYQVRMQHPPQHQFVSLSTFDFYRLSWLPSIHSIRFYRFYLCWLTTNWLIAILASAISTFFFQFNLISFSSIWFQSVQLDFIQFNLISISSIWFHSGQLDFIQFRWFRSFLRAAPDFIHLKLAIVEGFHCFFVDYFCKFRFYNGDDLCFRLSSLLFQSIWSDLLILFI